MDETSTDVEPQERRTHLRRAEDLQLLHYRTRTSEAAIKEVQAAIQSIEKTLAALVIYESRMQSLSMQVQGLTTYQDLLKTLHLQQDKWAADLQVRVAAVEVQMPMLLAVRGWVISGGLAVLGLVGVAVVMLVLRN